MWIFGWIYRERGKIFAKSVPDRYKETLLPIIQEHIQNQSIIYSDGWSAYNMIEDLPESYTHQIVKHSQNFVDTGTGIHT